MSFIKFRKITNAGKDVDRVLDTMQSNIQTSFSPLLDIAMLNGNLRLAESLAAGQDNLVAHGLGRKFISYFTGNPSAAGVVSTSATNNPNPDKYVILRTTISMTVDLWIF